MLEHIETLGEWKISKDTLTEQNIRERAYFKWLEAGCPDGNDNEIWLSAERELLYPTFSNLGLPVIGSSFYCLTQTPLVLDPEYNTPVDPDSAPYMGYLETIRKKLLAKIRGKNANDEASP